jgi:eukaryotic-like serine/threonine-protein kinase
MCVAVDGGRLATMGLQNGQRIRHYVVQDRLGGGGMGVVWRAWDGKAGRAVAIKAVADKYINIAEFGQRFGDEVRRHARLRHPNIVPVLDAFRVGDSYCMVMELIEGCSLEQLIQEGPGGRLDVDRAKAIMAEVLGALNYAHTRGIWHRDVKPSNILLDKEGHAHLADFGIALAIGEDRRTRTGEPVGTAAYMSPEQITNPKTLDFRTDVYSAGCMFYEMLTGRPPFSDAGGSGSDADFKLRSAHVHQAPVPPMQLVPSIPPRLNALILAALEKERDRRIPGCGAFLKRLNASDGATQSETVPPRLDRRAAAWVAAAIAVIIAALAFVGGRLV